MLLKDYVFLCGFCGKDYSAKAYGGFVKNSGPRPEDYEMLSAILDKNPVLKNKVLEKIKFLKREIDERTKKNNKDKKK